jgi:Adenylate and Guanylate cyclase catalytic domain
VFEPQIAGHHGRLVKTMGDGLPVEFHSVVDALRCAVEVQRAEAERNAYLPIDRRMVFRIGINLGNAIVGGNDIHGDGVNIAHRLQQLADCGGVVISGTTYDWVENKLEVGFESLGERRVKNVAKPLRVYRVRMEAEAAGKTFGVRQAAARVLRRPIIAVGALAVLIVVGIAAWSLPREQGVNSPSILRTALPPADKPSIAVLPFGNVGPKSEEAYFAQGLTDDLITDLSKISGLLVVARNSTSGYRDPTWSSPVRMNDVPTGHQFFPSIVADGNDIHVAWFDGRLNPAGSMITQLQVFYNRSIDRFRRVVRAGHRRQRAAVRPKSSESISGLLRGVYRRLHRHRCGGWAGCDHLERQLQCREPADSWRVPRLQDTSRGSGHSGPSKYWCPGSGRVCRNRSERAGEVARLLGMCRCLSAIRVMIDWL